MNNINRLNYFCRKKVNQLNIQTLLHAYTFENLSKLC